MLSAQVIYDTTLTVLKKADTHDVDVLAQLRHLEIEERSNFKNLLGMYVYLLGHRIIYLNGRMDEAMRRVVLAHEIGHDVFHRELATHQGYLQEFSLFSLTSETEYEANAFAAHFLIDTNEFEEYAKEGYSLEQIASFFRVPPELAAIKCKELNRLGCKYRLPYDPKASFLKNITV